MASPSINRQPYAYGDMFEDNAAGTNITITTAGTFYGWTTASASGLEDGVTFSSDATADRLTVNSTGQWLITATCSYNAGANDVTQGAIFVDGALTDIQWYRTMGAASTIGVAACSGILSVAENSYIDLRFTSDGNGDVMVINNLHVTVSKVGN